MLILGTTYQTARHQHWCASCGRHIEAGQRYSRQRCVDGGEAWVYKCHEWCERAMVALHKADREGVDDAYLNISEFDHEDRAIVWAADPDTYRRCWPGAPDLANGRADT